MFEPTSYCKYKVNDGNKKKLFGGTTKVTYDLYCISPYHNETLLLFYILWNLAARVVLSPTGGAVAVMQKFLFFIKDKQKSLSYFAINFLLNFFIELQRKHFFPFYLHWESWSRLVKETRLKYLICLSQKFPSPFDLASYI